MWGERDPHLMLGTITLSSPIRTVVLLRKDLSINRENDIVHTCNVYKACRNHHLNWPAHLVFWSSSTHYDWWLLLTMLIRCTYAHFLATTLIPTQYLRIGRWTSYLLGSIHLPIWNQPKKARSHPCKCDAYKHRSGALEGLHHPMFTSGESKNVISDKSSNAKSNKWFR
jgi:hypothetical protein